MFKKQSFIMLAEAFIGSLLLGACAGGTAEAAAETAIPQENAVTAADQQITADEHTVPAVSSNTRSDESLARPAETADLEQTAAIPVRVLILPKFERGKMTGDQPGEAQFYYDAYLKGGDEYEIKGAYEDHRLYVKDGIALYVTGMGKANAALSVQAILNDARFDFSNAYVISTGCGGSAIEYGIMGDVFVITATIDYDLGHHADARELETDRNTTWFHNKIYDKAAYRLLNQELCEKVYELTKDIRLEITDKTRSVMSENFGNADWAARDPMVLKGTAVTSDNYWKGIYDHANAVLMAETYGCPDPYAMTEMEDHAIAVALDRYNMLDRLIILRDSVDFDVFRKDSSPEKLWDPEYAAQTASSDKDDSDGEFLNQFDLSMENNFKVGSAVIDAILSSRL